MNNLPRVQKKNKNNKVQPFWVFFTEFKKIHHNIHDEQELKNLASQRWAELSIEEKDSYKEEAKTIKPTENKKRKLYNSLGQDIEEVAEEKRRKILEQQAMQEEIKTMIDNANNDGALDDLVFHFINTSSFYEDNSDIFPAELAMAKFSLRKGVFDDVQIRINPGKLPIGAQATARDKAKEILKYELPPDCEGEKDYMTILETIVRFVLPLDKFPTLFVEGDPTLLQQTVKTIKKIFYESEEDDVISELKIYPIGELFFYLKKRTTENKNRQNDKNDTSFTSVAAAVDKLKSVEFMYSSQGCNYHQESSQEFCCLSKVRCYGYIIAKWCSDDKRYELQEGKHFPEGYIHGGSE